MPQASALRLRRSSQSFQAGSRRTVVVNYDGDDAGIKAARKAIEHLLPHDFDIKVLVLPDGKDPDDFIRQNSKEAYNELRGKARTFLDFVLESAVKGRADMTIAKQKADAIEDVLPVLSLLRNPIQKRESFDQAMDFFRVENDAISPRPVENRQTVRQHAGRSSKTAGKTCNTVKITVAEQQLLELLINDEELRERILPQLEETDFEALATAEVFAACI